MKCAAAECSEQACAPTFPVPCISAGGVRYVVEVPFCERHFDAVGSALESLLWAAGRPR